MLKNRSLGFLIFAAAFFACMVSGCDIFPAGVYVPLGFDLRTMVFSAEEKEKGLSGVQASLRNDEKSVSALRETLSDKDGKVVFSVSENESFEGSYVLSTEEFDSLLSENSAFYIVVNDKASSHYNKEYETVVLKYDEKGAYERNLTVYLSRKCSAD